MIYGTEIKLDFESPDIIFNVGNDFELVSATDNLIQAVKTRLLTKLGTLATHVNFGSRLYELVGQNMDENAINAAGAYVHQAIENELRITEINALNIEFRIVDNKRVLVIFMTVTPIESDVPLNLVVNHEI